MDLAFSDEELRFRDEARAFVAANLPDDIAAAVRIGRDLSKEEITRWQKILFDKGWIAPHWPQAYGGGGWDATRRYIFDQVLSEYDTPDLNPFGLQMVGPVIYTFGNDVQKQRFLPPILSSDEWWCQGYSEPGAGSDLATLQTRAVRDGDHYIVNGTKTWTSLAQYADWIFCLVRTSGEGKPQEGITFLLIDMTTPGIEVKPIITIDGRRHVNMTYFTDVRVPVENRVGEENKGWTYAKFLLGHERLGIAAVGRSKRQLARLKEITASESQHGAPLAADGDFSRAIARVEIELQALEMTELRLLMQAAAGAAPGAEASMLKIRGTDIQQDITELTIQAVGYYGLPLARATPGHSSNQAPVGPDYAAPAASVYFNWRKSSIYGGTNEIQRNIIAKMVLGM